MLKVASLNANGIRAAYRRGMGAWLAASAPDVLALQEVRAGTSDLLELLGPEWHVAHAPCATAGRAGVAVASRRPLVGSRVGLEEVEPEHRAELTGRWVEAEVPLGGGRVLTVASVYVPKGAAGTDRMGAKYAFLDAMSLRLAELARSGGSEGEEPAAVVAGDLNIAHRREDLKNWQGNLGSAGFLPREREYLDRWLNGAGWVDVGRRLAGPGPGPYTWWSWRGRAFDSDTGWRIDYQLAFGAAAEAARSASVDRACNYAERLSDHAPIVAAYEL